jgi:multicomponent Na+:H+ antiporter subunit E
MIHLLWLGASLYGFWLLLSGHWDSGLLLALGGASTALVTLMAWRMQRLDALSFPAGLWRRLPGYWAWLFVEIIKANQDVVRRIWQPARFPISPTMAWLPASQKTDLGRAIYANSITLTPGTVAIEIDERGVLVHGLSAEVIADLRGAAMDRRVTRLEDREGGV